MKHANALSHNPLSFNVESESDERIFRIEEADWVLSGQLTDDKIRDIHNTLSKPPTTDAD